MSPEKPAEGHAKTRTPGTAAASHTVARPPTPKPVFLFEDLHGLDSRKRVLLQTRLAELSKLPGVKLRPGEQPITAEQAEYARVSAALKEKIADPVWAAVLTTLKVTDRGEIGAFPGALDVGEREAISVYGILRRDNATDTERPDKFGRSLALARAEYESNRPLFDATLDVLSREGGPEGGKGPIRLNSTEYAAVAHALSDQSVGANDPLLALKVRTVLANQTSATADDAAPSTLSIDLPDLEAEVDVDVLQDNLQAAQAIYYAAALEDVRLFAVVDKLVELFERGMLPIGRGASGDLLFRYWRKSVDRMAELERRNLYARVFGFPGGDAASVMPNREFPDLWMRFLSAVSSFNRQLTVDDLLRSTVPVAVSQEAAKKAGRDLAANLSLHSYGMAYFAATELQTTITDIIKILTSDDVKTAYGARDMWQVVDQVATLELGGARNAVRYRTMATTGAIIIRWLANNHELLRAGSWVPLLDPTELRTALPRSASHKPMVEPTARDLIEACEQWLAVTGTVDAQIEQYSQPVDGPAMTSRPVAIPEAAREVMSQFGIDGAALPV